jgi:hypothetical protein
VSARRACLLRFSVVGPKPSRSRYFGAHLTKEAAVVGPDEFLDQSTVVVEPENVQVHHNASAGGLHCAGGRLGERPSEGPRDPPLARDEVAFGDDDSAPDTAVVERGPERPEVLGQPRVVGVEAVGTVEDEVLGVEIRVDLLRVLAGDLQLSGPLPRSPGRHGAAPVVPYDRSLSRSCRPRDSRISYLILTSPSGAIKVPISYPICWLLPGACGNDRGPSGRPDLEIRPFITGTSVPTETPGSTGRTT